MEKNIAMQNTKFSSVDGSIGEVFGAGETKTTNKHHPIISNSDEHFTELKWSPNVLKKACLVTPMGFGT